MYRGGFWYVVRDEMECVLVLFRIKCGVCEVYFFLLFVSDVWLGKEFYMVMGGVE